MLFATDLWNISNLIGPIDCLLAQDEDHIFYRYYAWEGIELVEYLFIVFMLPPAFPSTCQKNRREWDVTSKIWTVFSFIVFDAYGMGLAFFETSGRRRFADPSSHILRLWFVCNSSVIFCQIQSEILRISYSLLLDSFISCFQTKIEVLMMQTDYDLSRISFKHRWE